jgi:hypothetical protein
MFKSILLGSAVAVTLSAAPAMATDFQALAHLQGPVPTPLDDAALAATEGGTVCISVHGSAADAQAPAAVCLVADLPGLAAFAVANGLPVVAAQFLQVSGLTTLTPPGGPDGGGGGPTPTPTPTPTP